MMHASTLWQWSATSPHFLGNGLLKGYEVMAVLAPT